MSILRSVFSGTITIYSLSYTTSNDTGEPLEVLTATGETADIAEMKSRVTYSVGVMGNIKVEDFRFLCERDYNPQTTVIEKDGVRYRIKAKQRAGLNNKTFGFTYSCILY